MATTTNFGWETPDDTDLVKDGALAIRTLGSAIDTSLVDLKGGTTGQVLSKTSNTDMDFTWVTSDDANAIQNAIVDAKGDLITATAADTPSRLGVGSNGQVLTADSTTATGLKWAAPAAGGLSWTLINAGGTSLTGAATITISGISGYDQILLMYGSASSASAGAAFGVRINGDTNTNYDGYGLGVSAPSAYASTFLSHTNQTGSNVFNLCYLSLNAGSVASGYCLITGASKTTVKVLTGAGGASASTSNSQIGYVLGGLYKGTSAVTSVSLFSDLGNFDAGTLWVYGA
jgi:hypothetical protein